MNTKHATERVYKWINDGTFNPADGCRHPRALIAAGTGLSEKTVTRAVAALEDVGRLRVERPKRRGWCNTYFVAEWSSPFRIRTLSLVRAAKCPPKRTAALSRAHTPPVSHQLNKPWHDQRCGREASEKGIQVSKQTEMLYQKLEAGGWRPQGQHDHFRSLCPAHNDTRNPSLGVREGHTLPVIVNCVVGCTGDEVLAALGMTWKELLDDGRSSHTLRRKPTRRHRDTDRPPTRTQLDRHLAEHGYPVDRVLARLGTYRCTPTPGFWIATCKVCDGELWIHAVMDEEGKPSGPVTLSCANGCIKNGRRV